MPAPPDWVARAETLQAALAGMVGRKIAWTPFVEVEPGVHHVSFPDYPPEMQVLWPLLREVGVGEPARYDLWQRGRPTLPKTRAEFAACSLDDVAMNFLTLVRAERFCDGVWAEALENGALAEGLARLLELRDALPYRADLGPWAVAPDQM